MPPLAQPLFREVRPDFFRVLGGPLSPLYVDALDALESESAQRPQGIDRTEALAIVQDVIGQHADLDDSPELPASAPAPDRARTVLETLRTAGWVHEEQRTNWQRLIHFEPNGTLLLHALRRIAFPEAAVFSDKLVNVCTTLSRGGEVNLDALTENPWAQIEACVASLNAGLAELHGMQKGIERHTRQQLTTTSLRENLAVLFDQFAERIGRTCYAQLVHARLPTRLSETRRALDALASHMDLLSRMQSEVMRREPNLPPDAAMARVRLRLNDLGEMLTQIEPLADAIDRRTAEFARRSRARFKYLQETTSENRARVQAFFETLNSRFNGHRVQDLDTPESVFPTLRLHEIRLFGGLESLYMPRLRRAPGEIEPLDETDPGHADRVLAQLEGNLRESLTVNRANRFIERLPGDPGHAWSSTDLLRDHIHNDEDIADLIACLLHARSSDARFSVSRPESESPDSQPLFDHKLQYRIERFDLVKR